jgi:hypothetical protein
MGDGSRLIELVRFMEPVLDDKGQKQRDPETGKVITEEIEATKDIKTFTDSVLLGPGVNEISDDEWLLAKPHLMKEGKAGLIKKLNWPATARKADGDGKRPNAKAITDLSVADATKLVEQCGRETNDKGQPMITADRGVRDTLYRWLVEDGRENVQAAIMNRLQRLRFLAVNERPLTKDIDFAKARLTFSGDAQNFEPEDETEIPEE